MIRGESDDTTATRECLDAILSGKSIWPCKESATTLRLLEPIAAVLGAKGYFECGKRLAQRPRMPFVSRNRYQIPGNISSQFVSGLLMALPLADRNFSEIAVDGDLQSASYVTLTEDVLNAAGIVFEHFCRETATGKTVNWRVPGRQKYAIEGGRAVEGDWSQAAFFLAMGVDVTGLNHDSHQGDRIISRHLETICNSHGGNPLRIDVSNTPDLYPVLRAISAVNGVDTIFTGTDRLRLKESDRLATTEAMVHAALNGQTIKTCGDHRIAMAAATMACYLDIPVTIDDPGCVSKSYPAFWEDFDRLCLQKTISRS